MTIISQFTSQELSCLFGAIVAVLAYLYGYWRGHANLSYSERCRIDDAARDMMSVKDDQIKWLRSLIDGDESGEGDEDDE